MSTPLQINTSSIDFNSGSTGFTSVYVPIDPTTEPPDCALPALNPASLALDETILTPIQEGCKFNFPVVFPIPPTFVPKILIPTIPCPQGITINSDVLFIGTGSAVVTGGINTVTDGCDYLLGGSIQVFVPEIPCPNGTSITGGVNITTSGIATGGGSINLIGGPCNFVLEGSVNISVPAPAVPAGVSFGGGGTKTCPTTSDLTGTGTTASSKMITFDSSSGMYSSKFPVPCFTCNTSATPASPFRKTDISLKTLELEKITPCTCCATPNSSYINFCTPEINIQDAANNNVSITGTEVYLNAISGKTITIQASDLGALTTAKFQQFFACVGGTPTPISVLAAIT